MSTDSNSRHDSAWEGKYAGPAGKGGRGGVTFTTGVAILSLGEQGGGDSIRMYDKATIFHFSCACSHGNTATEEPLGQSTEEGKFGAADGKRVSCT